MIKHGRIHVHSEYSTNDSVSSTDAIVRRAKELGCQNITLTDHGMVLGVEPFMDAGKKYGVNTIPGCEIYVNFMEMVCHMIFVAMNYKGWQLIQDIMKHAVPMKRTGENVYYLVDFAFLKTLDYDVLKNVIVTSACVNGPFGRILRSNEKPMKSLHKLLDKADALKEKHERYLTLSREIDQIALSLSKNDAEGKSLKKFTSKNFEKMVLKAESLNKSAQISIFEEEKDAEAKRLRQTFEHSKKRKKEIEEDNKRLKESKSKKTKERSEVNNPHKKYQESLHQIAEIKQSLKPKAELIDLAKRTAKEFQGIFPNFYLELQYHGLQMEADVMPIVAEIAEELNIPVIAANDDHMVTKDDFEARQIIRFGYFGKHQTLSKEDRELYIKTDAEMISALSKILPQATVEKAMENLAILHQCKVVMPTDPHYPRVPGKVSFRDLLEKKRKEMIAENRWSETYEKRLYHEIEVIEKMGYVDYHMVVRDFCNMARILGRVPKSDYSCIPLDFSKIEEWIEAKKYNVGVGVGPGRGSAAGSLVCYMLGISNIDPIKYDLLFERYLNPERVSMPDIDTDIKTSLRQYVIRYMRWLYGENAICSIATETRLGLKEAIHTAARDIASERYDFEVSLDGEKKSKKKADRDAKVRAFKNNFSFPMADRFGKDYKSLSEIPEEEIATLGKEECEVLRRAKLIEGCVVSTGVHAGGVVISDNDNIGEYVPLLWNDKKNVWVAQCNMIKLEEKGCLKMDLLGLNNLDIISDALWMIQKRRGIAVNIDKISLDDADVYRHIYQSGRTNSVFQFESDGMKKMLKEFKPETFLDLILLVAAYRPGPMQYLEDIIKVKKGEKPLSYKHPILESISNVTYGYFIYQEQIMAVFQKLAGYSLGNADLVRRAMSKKVLEKLEKERIAFISGDTSRNIEGCVDRIPRWEKEHGHPVSSKEQIEILANEIFDEIMDFAKYCFNKSHAACYALVSYETAWLKEHYPLEFACSLLNNSIQEDFAPILTDLSIAGYKVLPPDIMQSYYDFVIEGQCIRYGFSGIKGISEKTKPTLERICRERNRMKFTSFADYIRRSGLYKDKKGYHLDKSLTETLILSGCFSSLADNRTELCELYADFCKKMEPTLRSDPEKIPYILDQAFQTVLLFDAYDAAERDKEFLGDIYSFDPLINYAEEKCYQCTPFPELESDVLHHVLCYIHGVSYTTSKKGKKMVVFEAKGKTGAYSLFAMDYLFKTPDEWIGKVVKATVKYSYGRIYIKEMTEQSAQRKRTIYINDSMEKNDRLKMVYKEDEGNPKKTIEVLVSRYFDKEKRLLPYPYTLTRIMLSEEAVKKLQ